VQRKQRGKRKTGLAGQEISDATRIVEAGLRP
jgi:hypothetical protein